MFEQARLRLAAWFAAALLAVVLVLGAGAYLVLRRELDSEIDEALDRAIADLAGQPISGLRPEPGRRNGEAEEGENDEHDNYGSGSFEQLSSDVFAIWLNADGTIAANPRRVETAGIPFEQLVTMASPGVHREDVTAGGEHLRLEIAAIDSDHPGWLLVGRSLDARDHQLAVLAMVMAFGGAGSALLAATGGFWIAGRALVPIRESLEAQRRFVSDASHELRTPIAVVRANAEVLLRHPDQTVEANIDQVAAISDVTASMSQLVGDLLTLARADEQRLGLVTRPVLLHELLDGLVRDMAALADGRGIALAVNLRAAELQADGQRLRQVAAILIDNALKFTPAGGSVTVRCRRDGQRAEFSVVDTGPGIPAGDQPHIFDRFYRSDRARTGDGGTGLGLAIARSIVEAHGGRITLESTPGGGATFTVRLPLRPRSAPVAAAR